MQGRVQIVIRTLLVLVAAVLVVSGIANVLNWIAQIVSWEADTHLRVAWVITCAAIASALFVYSRAHVHNVNRKGAQMTADEARQCCQDLHQQLAELTEKIGAPDGEDVLDAIDTIAEASAMITELMDHPDVVDHPGLYPELHQVRDQLDMARTFLGDTDAAEEDGRNEAIAVAVHSLHDDERQPSPVPDAIEALKAQPGPLQLIPDPPTITPPARDPNS